MRVRALAVTAALFTCAGPALAQRFNLDTTLSSRVAGNSFSTGTFFPPSITEPTALEYSFAITSISFQAIINNVPTTFEMVGTVFSPQGLESSGAPVVVPGSVLFQEPFEYDPFLDRRIVFSFTLALRVSDQGRPVLEITDLFTDFFPGEIGNVLGLPGAVLPDEFRFVGFLEVVPAPGATALLMGGGLLAARRRRS